MNNLFLGSGITIQSKLVRIIVLVSTVALLVAATLFTIFQLREYRQSMIESLTSTASITAENVQAAVWFDNKRDATNILSELSNDHRILTAAIYTKEKVLFAAYGQANKNTATLLALTELGELYQLESGAIHLYQPITLQTGGSVIGYVYLEATLAPLYQQLKKNIVVTALIVLSVLIVTILITTRLQKLISAPILKLLRATEAVKNNKDYSLRVDNTEYLEIQKLSEGFNAMLGEIQSRDKHLQHLALYDELTGIPNRSLFINHFNTAIARSKRTGTQLAVCFLDIDNFKPINDGFGHEVGDALLIEVAKRISGSIREEDSVSRQGGDEFAILLGDIQSLEQLEQSIERIIQAVAQPYTIDRYQHKITASSGVTLYPSDDGDVDTLIRHADQAMYNAKLAGKNCYHLFNSQHNQTILLKRHLIQEIEQALISKQLRLFYQPKVNMITGDICGFEALIRWDHPEKGLIPPLDFLPIIEGSTLESQIGDWVINQALTQLEAWQSLGINIEVSVNISSRHLHADTFTMALEKALAKRPTVEPRLLQLEILESSALGDIHAVSNIILGCKNLGVSIALDDFGTGYSSLTHLRRLPVDKIKVDQSFVRGMLDDPSDYAIVNSVIGLADSFGRSVIAEGVETSEHGLLLLVSGCAEAQGYGIARPMPAEEVASWCLSYKPNPLWMQCGSEQRTIQAGKIKLLKLFFGRWLDRFEKNINNAPGQVLDWPVMDSQHSHCHHWVKKEIHEQLFDAKWLRDLDNSHEKFHEIANDVHFKYQKDEVKIAREAMGALHIAADEVSKLIQKAQ